MDRTNVSENREIMDAELSRAVEMAHIGEDGPPPQEPDTQSVEEVDDYSRSLNANIRTEPATFSDLPNEIRLQIYELVLGPLDDEQLWLWTEKDENKFDPEVLAGHAEDRLKHRRLHAISMCSRRVRFEFVNWYLPRMCSEKTFRFWDAISPAARPEFTAKFMSTLPLLNRTFFLNPVPMSISVCNKSEYLFESEGDVLQVVRDIPGINALVLGSRIEIYYCSIQEEGVHDNSARSRDGDRLIFETMHDGYDALFRFEVKEEGVMIDSIWHDGYWRIDDHGRKYGV